MRQTLRRALLIVSFLSFPVVMNFLSPCVTVAFSLAVGKRSFCHHLCRMAPFVIAGTRLARGLRLPSLRLGARPELCARCGTCTKNAIAYVFAARR